MSRRHHLVAVAAFALASVPCVRAQAIVGEVYASDASVKGTVILAAGGTRVFSGSQVSAGGAAAVLKLARGGEIRICPGTQLAVSSSASGNELLLSVSTGALELHYAVGAVADSIVTPDFQVQLVGPGDFHLGFGADERGATCVRGLQQNTASVIVSEMMGDGRYQVQPNEEVVFRDGRVNTSQHGALVHCGCPEPVPVMRAEAKAPPPPAQPVKEEVAAAPTPAAPEPEIHVQVDAPFVFRGDSDDNDIAWQVSRLQTSSKNDYALMLQPMTVIPPPEPAPEMKPAGPVAAQTPKQGGGFFRKLGRFFGKIFRG